MKAITFTVLRIPPLSNRQPETVTINVERIDFIHEWEDAIDLHCRGKSFRISPMDAERIKAAMNREST